MKVLFIASVYRHLTAFHLPYMKYLNDKGFDIWVAGAENAGEKERFLELGYYCIDIPFSRNPLSKENFAAFKKLKILFKKEAFEIVHVHTPVAALLTRMAFRNFKKGHIIYTAHGFHFYNGAPLMNWLIYYPLERLTAKWTDKLITINDEDYKRALSMRFNKNAVHYVHGVGVESVKCTVNVSKKKKMKKKLGISEDAVVISYVAEINTNKNHQFLLRNWKDIKNSSPNAVLLLIGDGTMRLEIEQLIEDMQLDDVHILGFRTDVYDLLEITDIVSLLSYREGLPKSIMEAMTKSIPCIVSDTRGLRDLIVDGRNGYVVAHDNNDALVKSFASLLNNEEKRKQMGVMALQEVEPYLLKNVFKEYVEIYDNILRNG